MYRQMVFFDIQKLIEIFNTQRFTNKKQNQQPINIIYRDLLVSVRS